MFSTDQNKDPMVKVYIYPLKTGSSIITDNVVFVFGKKNSVFVFGK